MSESPLSRHAGPIALVAGILFAGSHVVLFAVADLDERITTSLDPLFQTFSGAYFFAFFPLMLSLIAAYGREAREAGTFGVIAFCAAVLGTMTMAGDVWFDSFAAPWLAEVAPQTFAAEKTITLQIGALSAYLFFALGWALFGLASLRARVFPAAISLAIVVAGVIGFRAALTPYGVPIGLAAAALGGWLIYSDRTTRTLPEPAATS